MRMFSFFKRISKRNTKYDPKKAYYFRLEDPELGCVDDTLELSSSIGLELENCLDAKKYWGYKISLFTFRPTITDYVRQIFENEFGSLENLYDFRKEAAFLVKPDDDSEKTLIDARITNMYPKTEVDVKKAINKYQYKIKSEILETLPCRKVYIDDRESINCSNVHFEGEYREIDMYTPTDKSGTCIVSLKIYRVYNGSPYEGGRMEGYVCNRYIITPASDYFLPDQELIRKYSFDFRE